MIRRSLLLHPESRCDALTGIEVEVARLAPRRLFLRFIPSGKLRQVRMARRGWRKAERRDELWRHTCFEAFLRPGPDGSYYEFNLAPSGDWAAYRFSGYRHGMESVGAVGPPGDDPFPRGSPRIPAFAAVLELDALAALPTHEAWRLGLSAIIEDRNGRLSYWALAHPPGPPDFHDPDGFQLELPPARPA